MCVHRSHKEGAVLCRALGARGVEAELFVADLQVREQCRELSEKVLQRFGTVDILINNAASFAHVDVCEATDDELEEAFRVSMTTNALVPLRLVRAFAGALRTQRGSVVNLADVSGAVWWPDLEVHGASKAALAYLTRVLARTLGPEVRVNAVAPGIAIFPERMDEAERARLVDKTALKRPGSAKEVAEAVVFLASSPYTTGVVLPVDGGWTVPV
jgi:pteridine reductase